MKLWVLDLKYTCLISASHPRADGIPNGQLHTPPVPMESSFPGCGHARSQSRKQVTRLPSHHRFLIFHLTLFPRGPFEARTPCNLCSSFLPPLHSFPREAHLTARRQKLIFSISESLSLSCCLRNDQPSSRGEERRRQSKETWAGVEGSMASVQLALLRCPRMNYQVLSGQLSPKGGHCVTKPSCGTVVERWFIPRQSFTQRVDARC